MIIKANQCGVFQGSYKLAHLKGNTSVHIVIQLGKIPASLLSQSLPFYRNEGWF